MSEIALKVEDLSKLYRLGELGTDSLSDDLLRFWCKLRGKSDPLLHVAHEEPKQEKAINNYLWALKNINFEIKKGQTTGIIGRNGAGKSTLLKILSRITSPTTGRVVINGSFASLLEVGTGMHPELTARENIFLNGLILGMSKAEVKRKFDDIVDFAGIYKFVDTPVKRFSSGMRVRLGFAVAAFLEPDIMIIDEVLAVGDREFTKKAIEKVREVCYNEGRTALFVSHNMQNIRKLCNKTMLFNDGEMINFGKTDDVILNYISQGNTENLKRRLLKNEETGTELISEMLIELQSNYNANNEAIIRDKSIELVLNYKCKNELNTRLDFSFRFKQEDGSYIFTSSTDSIKDNFIKKGDNSLLLEIPPSLFNPGVYYIDFFIIENKHKLIIKKGDFLYFTVKSSPNDLEHFYGKFKTYLNLDLPWKIV